MSYANSKHNKCLLIETEMSYHDISLSYYHGYIKVQWSLYLIGCLITRPDLVVFVDESVILPSGEMLGCGALISMAGGGSGGGSIVGVMLSAGTSGDRNDVSDVRSSCHRFLLYFLPSGVVTMYDLGAL